MIKNLITILLLFLSSVSFSQIQTQRFLNGKVNCTQTSSGVNTFTVSCNFTDEGGLYDGTNVLVGDYLYFTDGGYGYYLPITSIVSAGPSTVVVVVSNTGTGLGAVPTTTGYITRGSENFNFTPYVSGITNADQQVASEQDKYILDSLLFFRLPERVSGSVPPAYTPLSDQAWIAQSNGTGSVFRWDPNLAEWVELGGIDTLNGIYTGSDTVPKNTVAFLDSTFSFYSTNSDAVFTVQIGEFNYGNLIVNSDKSQLSHNQVLTGENKVEVNSSGVSIVTNTNGTDYIKILGPILLNKILSPSIINSNQNNYSPSGINSANFVRLSSSSNVDITGIGASNNVPGRIIGFHNIGSFKITLKNNSGSSLPGNRFFLSDDYSLSPNDVVLAQYDSSSLGWRLFETPRQYIDTLQFVGTKLRLSLFNDKRPMSEIDLYFDSTGIANVYNIDDTTTDITRTLQVLRNFLIRSDGIGDDSIGYIRFEFGKNDGSRILLNKDTATIFFTDTTTNNLSYITAKKDSTIFAFHPYNIDAATNLWHGLVGDTVGLKLSTDNTFKPHSISLFSDTINWKGAYNTQLHRHNFITDSTYFFVDTFKTFALGRFPGIEALNYDGREKGFFYQPDGEGILLMNGEGTPNRLSYALLGQNNFYLSSSYISGADSYGMTADFGPGYLSIGGAYNTTGTYFALDGEGSNEAARFRIRANDRSFGDTTSFIDLYQTDEGFPLINSKYVAFGERRSSGGSAVGSVAYLGYDNGTGFSTSTNIRSSKLGFGIQHVVPGGSGYFDYFRVDLETFDTTRNNISFYNRSYYWKNGDPSPTLGDTSIHFWAGNGSGTTPGFMTINDLLGGVGSNIIDTVYDYTDLRAYADDAPLVFVKKDGIEGIFKRVSGSWVDDGGITIVGTYDWRRVADNLSKVNVKWFEAVGDSLTNDNTAIQAALDFVKDSTNATLYFPAGKYRYTSTINIYKPNNIAILGDGMHNTYLLPENVTGIRYRTDSTTTVVDSKYGIEGRDFFIRDLSIIRVGSNTFNGKIYGIDKRGGFNTLFENVRVEEFFATGGTGVGSVGIRLWPTLSTDDAAQHNLLRNVWVTECDTGIVVKLHNVTKFEKVVVDQNHDVGVVLSSGLFWEGGMCQGNENTGIWIRNGDPFVFAALSISDVHFESNAYVTPKWGTFYKTDDTDATDISITNCYLSSPGNSHLFRLNRVQYFNLTSNKYAGDATTDTIRLTSVYSGIVGNDNYTSLKLVTSDARVTWLNGTSASTEEYVGLSIGTPEPGSNYLNVNGGIGVGSTYYNIIAPSNGAIFEGNVGIKNSSPSQPLHVTGNARVTGAFFDSNNEAGTSAQALTSTVTGTDWVTLYTPSGLGTSNQLLGMNNAGDAFEWKTFLGTTNQVTITDGVGTKTWSLPQDIHTAATPQFAGLTLDAATPFITFNGVTGTSVTSSGTTNTWGVGNSSSTTSTLSVTTATGQTQLGGFLPSIIMQRNGTSSAVLGPYLYMYTNDGSALDAGHLSGLIEFGGRVPDGSIHTGAAIASYPVATYTNTSSPNKLSFSTTPSGTTTEVERVVINHSGETQFLNAQGTRYYDSNNGNFVHIRAPQADSLTANYTWVLPKTKGTTNQVLSIYADSLLRFVDVSSIYTPDGNGIYGGDGTVPDDTYARIDSTFLFALGEFPNFPNFTWGRGFYYDPGDAGNPTRDIRIHNKRDDNTAFSYLRVGEQSNYLSVEAGTNISYFNQFSSTTSSTNQMYSERPASSYGRSELYLVDDSNESGAILIQNGEGSIPSASIYVGDGYSSSSYNKYPDRAAGIQSVLSNGPFDWIQVLLPNTATDSTGNNISFYNRKYYWSNEVPDITSGDTSVHVWIGNGTTASPDFIDLVDFTNAHAQNIYNSNGTTDDNTRTLNILQALKFVGTADIGDPYPFQVIVTGNDQPIQLWKGNADSVWIKQSDVEYVFSSSAPLIVGSDDYLIFSADSIIATAGSVASKTKIRNILGLTPNNGTIERFDGDAAGAGDMLVSNGTDWVITNLQAELRPAQLAATTNNWSPTGYSTFANQTIRFSGDNSFRTVTGLTAATRNRVTKTFYNDGTNCVVFAKQHTGSSAGNRFDVTRDVVFYPGMSAIFAYDSIGADWELVSTNKAEVTYSQVIDYDERDWGAVSGDNWWEDFNAFGGTYAKSSASSTQPLRVNRLTTSTAATAYPSVTSYTGQIYQVINKTYMRTYARVRLEDLSTAAEDFDFRMGFAAAIDTNEAEGAYITYKREINSGGFHIRTHNGTTPTETNAGSAIAADTYYEIELIYYPYGEVTAFIDGVRYTTTSTLPDAIGAILVFQIDKDNGATSRELMWTAMEAHWVYVSE